MKPFPTGGWAKVRPKCCGLHVHPSSVIGNLFVWGFIKDGVHWKATIRSTEEFKEHIREALSL